MSTSDRQKREEIERLPEYPTDQALGYPSDRDIDRLTFSETNGGSDLVLHVRGHEPHDETAGSDYEGQYLVVAQHMVMEVNP